MTPYAEFWEDTMSNGVQKHAGSWVAGVTTMLNGGQKLCHQRQGSLGLPPSASHGDPSGKHTGSWVAGVGANQRKSASTSALVSSDAQVLAEARLAERVRQLLRETPKGIPGGHLNLLLTKLEPEATAIIAARKHWLCSFISRLPDVLVHKMVASDFRYSLAEFAGEIGVPCLKSCFSVPPVLLPAILRARTRCNVGERDLEQSFLFGHNPTLPDELMSMQEEACEYNIFLDLFIEEASAGEGVVERSHGVVSVRRDLHVSEFLTWLGRDDWQFRVPLLLDGRKVCEVQLSGRVCLGDVVNEYGVPFGAFDPHRFENTAFRCNNNGSSYHKQALEAAGVSDASKRHGELSGIAEANDDRPSRLIPPSSPPLPVALLRKAPDASKLNGCAPTGLRADQATFPSYRQSF